MSTQASTSGQLSMADAFSAQRELCAQLGSRVYDVVLQAATDDLLAGGPVWTVMQEVADLPPGSYPALRLLGSVHRLVLEGQAPRLAAQYPSTGGHPDADLTDAFMATVAEHAEVLRAMVRQTPQTNEVGRSAALLVGFLAVARSTGLPLRVLEIGSSAGLNLAWDHYRYESGNWAWGPPGSPVRISDAFVGGTPEPVQARISERAGCDVDPVNVYDEGGRTTLLSYIWPDQTQRMQRLRAATELVRTLDPPLRIDRADAVSWLRARLETPAAGVATIVTHSIVTAYFDQATHAAYEQVLAAAAQRATPGTPLAEVSLEAVGGRFEVGLRLWPGGERRALAEVGGHGLPVRLLPPA